MILLLEGDSDLMEDLGWVRCKMGVPSFPKKLTNGHDCRNIHHLKMYFLLKIGIFQCHVSFRGCFDN